MKIIKYAVCIFLMSIIGYIFWIGYCYFFDMNSPVISLIGIENNESYKGDVSCILMGRDDYKVGSISVYLDNRALISDHKINAATFEHSFVVPTRTLPEGKHTLKITAVDSAYHKNYTDMEYSFFVDNVPLQATLIKPTMPFNIFQGQTLHVQFQTNKILKSAVAHVLEVSYPCFPESNKSHIYECFIPIACEERPNEYLLNFELKDTVGNLLTLDHTFQITLFPFKKTTLRVNQEKVQEEAELGRPQEELEKELHEFSIHSPQKKLWQGPFYPPIEILRVSTEFGAIRITQEKGRYQHKAVDVINTPKSVVWAPQDGIIRVKDRFAQSGNTVVIDHGFNIFSLFFHLDSFADLCVNDTIKRGNPIGTIGKTGYASGYHLHWEMRVNNIPVDPLQWVNLAF